MHSPGLLADVAFVPPPSLVRCTDEVVARLHAVRVAAFVETLPVVRGAFRDVLVNIFILTRTLVIVITSMVMRMSRQ